MALISKTNSDSKKKPKKIKIVRQKLYDTRKVVGYILEKSGSPQVDEYSLEQQQNAIKDYCRRNLLFINKIFTDAAGENSSDPTNLQQLRKQIESDQVKVLIAYKLDCLGSSQQHVMSFLTLLEEHQVRLITIDPEIDYSTHAGQIILANLKIFARLERNMIVDRTEQGRLKKFSSGSKCQGAILGYQHNKKNNRYEIIPEEAKLVYLIFRGYLREKSLAKLADLLNSQGYKTKRQNLFNKSNVQVILNNRFYTGSAFYKGQEIQGNHEPIISKELFGRVQAKLNRNKKRK